MKTLTLLLITCACFGFEVPELYHGDYYARTRIDKLKNTVQWRRSVLIIRKGYVVTALGYQDKVIRHHEHMANSYMITTERRSYIVTNKGDAVYLGIGGMIYECALRKEDKN